MSSQITYDDKMSLTTSPLPRANKCTAEDLNEIKQVVNENGLQTDAIENNLENLTNNVTNIITKVSNMSEYSTNETQIGIWINGKPLYRRVIPVDSFPNTENKSIPIDNVDVMINLKAYATNGTETYYLPSAYNSLNFDSVLYRNADNAIRIHTSSDRSAYSGYIIAEYTKTTD